MRAPFRSEIEDVVVGYLISSTNYRFAAVCFAKTKPPTKQRKTFDAAFDLYDTAMLGVVHCSPLSSSDGIMYESRQQYKSACSYQARSPKTRTVHVQRR
ncbi:hypothetical protein CTAYLR_003094 [Chrysophaeum taylorii]|uniref:Uncharacterized protein n=1 Tax=Chrysophaeum taylorii TaxID=2483200 RepID=A0AAD7XEW2_9STRA|nr:hypothetical protein CTAYLR_003094 [Chrysophaeum taylorii]